jgi:hypothetical protein
MNGTKSCLLGGAAWVRDVCVASRLGIGDGVPEEAELGFGVDLGVGFDLGLDLRA